MPRAILRQNGFTRPARIRPLKYYLGLQSRACGASPGASWGAPLITASPRSAEPQGLLSRAARRPAGSPAEQTAPHGGGAPGTGPRGLGGRCLWPGDAASEKEGGQVLRRGRGPGIRGPRGEGDSGGPEAEEVPGGLEVDGGSGVGEPEAGGPGGRAGPLSAPLSGPESSARLKAKSFRKFRNRRASGHASLPAAAEPSAARAAPGSPGRAHRPCAGGSGRRAGPGPAARPARSGRLPAPAAAAAGGGGPAPRPPPRGQPPAGGPQYRGQCGSNAISGTPGPAAQAPSGPATSAARTPGHGRRRAEPAGARERPATNGRAASPALGPPTAPGPAHSAQAPPRAGRRRSSARAAFPVAARAGCSARLPSRCGPRSSVADPLLSREPSGATKGGPRPPRHPPGASLPGRLQPRPSWKWEAAGRGQGHEQAGTRPGEPSGGAHRWAPLPRAGVLGTWEPGPRRTGRGRRFVWATPNLARDVRPRDVGSPSARASLSLPICKTGFSGNSVLLNGHIVPGALDPKLACT